MADPDTKFVRYVFLDIAGFTKNRSVEAQTEIVGVLNHLVKVSVQGRQLPDDSVIFLPTGDGMGIAVLDQTLPYDIHLSLGLDILAKVFEYNRHEPDEKRRFELRVGVNQNVDNIVIDINDASNVAGAGVNEAQRIMNTGDPSQLMVGQAVYDTLQHRESYMHVFRAYRAEIKHGTSIQVYQLVKEHAGLSTSVPSQFVTKSAEEKKLTRFEAYYLAHAFSNRDFMLRCNRTGGNSIALILVLWFLAGDSVEEDRASEYSPPVFKLVGAGKLPLVDVVNHYAKIDYWTAFQLASFIIGAIRPIVQMSEWSSYPGCIFFSDVARKKLASEHQDIWNKFRLHP